MYSKTCVCGVIMCYKSQKSLSNSNRLNSKCKTCQGGGKRIHHFTENVFKIIDSQDKAYWLGFIFGDGHVTRSGLKIEISQKDEEHLSKFSNFMSYTGTIKPTRKNCCVIHLNSKFLAFDLFQYGLQSPKILTTPNIDPILLSHFYRGFFDADGWITHRKPKNGSKISYEYGFCCSDKRFLLDVQTYLSEQLGHNRGYLTLHTNPLGSVQQIIFGGNIIFQQISQILYKDANYYLDRKYDLMQNAVQYLENTPDMRGKYQR